MRHLLLLTCFFPPDNTPAAARPGQLYDYLPEHDYQPIVVASSSEGSLNVGEFVRRIPSSDEATTVRFVSNLARWFMRFCAPYNDRLPWVPQAASAAASLIKSRPVDAIYSTSPSLAAHFAALWLKARFGLPWIADFQDPVRDNPMRTRKWVYPYDALVEFSIFRYADRLIANTDTVAAAWCARYPQWAHKISVLWNSFDPHEEIETTLAPPRDYRVLAHIGSLYGGRDPGLALSAFERLGVDASAIRIRLVGPIETGILARRAALFERMRRSGVLEFDNARVPREEAVRETAQADYLLLLDVNDSNASFQVPSKLLDYIRYGKPILAFTPTGSPVERILVQSGIPYVTVAPDVTEANCDQKVFEFLGFATKRSQASAWFEENFSAKTQARTLSRLLNGLLPPKTPSNSHNPVVAEESSMLVL
jgi:glycosyltransferase involved in cell wall biosynthesis